MKKSKKLMAVLMTAILGTALFLTGCGEKPVAGDVTVKAFYNLIILGDSAEIERTMLTKDQATQMLNTLKTGIKSETKKFLSELSTPSDEQLEAIYNAQMESLKKLTSTTEVVSEDGDNATVKLTTNYIDQKGIDDKASTDAVNELQKMGITSQTELNKKGLELYVRNLVEGLKSAQPSTETKVSNFECEKITYDVKGENKEIFGPKDAKKFGETIMKMATNQ